MLAKSHANLLGHTSTFLRLKVSTMLAAHFPRVPHICFGYATSLLAVYLSVGIQADQPYLIMHLPSSMSKAMARQVEMCEQSACHYMHNIHDFSCMGGLAHHILNVVRQSDEACRLAGQKHLTLSKLQHDLRVPSGKVGAPIKASIPNRSFDCVRVTAGSINVQTMKVH